jgi:molybdopterin-guanine dinucleotide biosynthesis protein A
LEVTREITPEVRIVGAPEKFADYGPVISDVYADCGPLGGIHAALTASNSDLNLVLAVDIPFVSARFLQYLVARAQTSGAFVTVPSINNYYQPLCAVYRKQFAELADQALKDGKNKIDALFQDASLYVISEEEIVSNGFSPTMFRNLNTPEEWEEAKRVFVSER